MVGIDEVGIPKSSLRVAVAQAVSLSGDILKNVERAVAMINEAAKKGADIIVFPEKFLTGYVPEMIVTDLDRYALSPNDPRLDPVRDVCKLYQICAILGTPTRSDGDLYISSVVIDGAGAELLAYHKTHLFHSEKGIFKSDDELNILNLKDWNIGLAICYDAGFPEHSRALAQAGCHVYLVSSLFSKGIGYLESRVWFPARALDNTMYAVMTNHAGKTGVWDACGGSAVWNPFGQLVAEASESESEVLLVDLDPSTLREARTAERMLADSVGIRHITDNIVMTRMEANERE